MASMKLRDVELTGVVTLFYNEYCAEKKIIESKDSERTRIYQYFSKKYEKKNIHHLQEIESIDLQGIVDVSYRNKIFDELLIKQIETNRVTEIVNLGCGFDTRFFRLNNFKGNYFDIDLPHVISEKRKILSSNERYYLIETDSITSDEFDICDLGLKSLNPVFIAEGLFCYIEYPTVLKFVKMIFDVFPNATLICDVYLYENHFCFNNSKSKFLLKHPIHGEVVYCLIEKFGLVKHENRKEWGIDGKTEMKSIILIDVYNQDTNPVELDWNGKKIYPQYWVGIYRKES